MPCPVLVAHAAEERKQKAEQDQKDLGEQVHRRKSGTAVAGAREGGKVKLDVTKLVGGKGQKGTFQKSFKAMLREERERVQNCAPLHQLTVSGCQLTDVALKALAEWPYLRHLSVSQCDELTDVGGVALASNCTRLKVRADGDTCGCGWGGGGRG